MGGRGLLLWICLFLSSSSRRTRSSGFLWHYTRRRFVVSSQLLVLHQNTPKSPSTKTTQEKLVPTTTTTSLIIKDGGRKFRVTSQGESVVPPPRNGKTQPKNKSKPTTTATTRAKTKKNKWDDMIARLEEFYRQNGHTLVTKGHDPDLYKWTASIRANYRHQVMADKSTTTATTTILLPTTINGMSKPSSPTTVVGTNLTHLLVPRPELSAAKLRKLQAIDFPWDVQSAVWHQRYGQLLKFRERHGHCRVPPTNLDFVGLGVWVRNQRREYRQLTAQLPSTLTVERLQALEAIGFEWNKSRYKAWDKKYRELVLFQINHGHANVPEDYKENFSLGQWCMNQRTAYKRYCAGEPTALTTDRIQKLESIGFVWNYREHLWCCMLDRLKQYYQEHGHVIIPTKDEANQDLRIWLIVQRYHYNQQKREKHVLTPLTDRRIEALQKAVPEFSWKARDSSGPKKEDWAKLFDAMREKGIAPNSRPKQHWFEGINPFSIAVKDKYTEQDYLELWNQQDDDDDDDDDDGNDVNYGYQ